MRIIRKNLRFIEAPVEDETLGGGEPKTFTQEDLSALMAKEKAQGRRAGERAVTGLLSQTLKDAGFAEDADLKEVLTLAAAKRDADDAAASDAEKAVKAAEAREAEAAKKIAQAEAREFNARATIALAGAVDVNVAKAALAAYDVTPASSDEDLTEAITKLKTAAPGLFEKAVTVTTDPGSSRTGTTSTETPRERAARRAQAQGWTKN